MRDFCGWVELIDGTVISIKECRNIETENSEGRGREALLVFKNFSGLVICKFPVSKLFILDLHEINPFSNSTKDDAGRCNIAEGCSDLL